MAQTHTPGPWQAYELEIMGDGRMVASCHWVSGFNDEDANARLIAAAPDLLTALEAALAQMQDIEECTSLEWRSDALSAVSKWNSAMTMAEDAIAKARGDQ